MYYADSDCPVKSLTMLTDEYTVHNTEIQPAREKLITKFNLETFTVYLLEILQLIFYS